MGLGLRESTSLVTSSSLTALRDTTILGNGEILFAFSKLFTSRFQIVDLSRSPLLLLTSSIKKSKVCQVNKSSTSKSRCCVDVLPSVLPRLLRFWCVATSNLFVPSEYLIKKLFHVWKLRMVIFWNYFIPSWHGNSFFVSLPYAIFELLGVGITIGKVYQYDIMDMGQIICKQDFLARVKAAMAFHCPCP